MNVEEDRSADGTQKGNIPYFKITNAVVETAGRDRMGQVKSGNITLVGCLKQAILRGNDYGGGWKKICDKNDKAIGCISPNIFPNPDLDMSISCSGVAITTKSSLDLIHEALYESPRMDNGRYEKQVIGIALVKVNGIANTYTRIRLVKWMRRSLVR